MIEYALLIMLGFCVGGLIAFLLAPTLWHRAVRLTTKRLEATMPMSLSDIEADKDLLRASYAIKIRRLEAGLSKTRDKSANQLVEISRLQMQIGELQDAIAGLQTQLDERRNAAAVFENTIRKRFPELESAVAAAKVALDGRAYEVTDLTSKLRRREEALTITQRTASQQQQEIKALRETLEKAGSDTTGRFKRRPAQWTLDEYRSEYDRLNVEMSKMREQLVLGHEREAGQIAVLRTELQQLGEQIMHSVAAQERHEAVSRKPPEPEPKPWPGSRADAAPSVPKRGLPARALNKAQPWPGDKPKDVPPVVTPSRMAAPAPEKVEAKPPVVEKTESKAGPSPARQTRSRWTEPALPKQFASPANKVAPAPQVAEASAGVVVADAGPVASPVTADTRDALRMLLDRGPRLGRAEMPKESGPETGGYRDVMEDAVIALSKEAAQTLDVEFEVVADTPQGNGGAAPHADAPAAEPAASPTDPKLDQVLREIIESRASAQPTPPESVEDAAATPETPARSAESATATEAEGKRTLLDRLRVMQERQTG